TPGLYDVYLNVKGNEVKNIKPIDIVLVVDMSGSMNSSLNGGNDRVGATRQGVKNFLKTINDAGIGKYVNVGVVGFSSPGYISSSGTLSENIDSSDNQAHITRINDLLANEFKGGTFTQLGIRTGQSMLASDSNDHKKMMIMLTDGVPTFSYKVSALTNIGGIDYGTAFGTKRDEPGNTSQLSSNYYVSNGNGIVKDTWTATLGEARIAKNSGTELHALGIQIGADKNYLTKDQVRDKMLLLASSGLYQDANSAS
ncbi:VWA domain-containing protein, partial [Leuconostoc falkenbergense]